MLRESLVSFKPETKWIPIYLACCLSIIALPGCEKSVDIQFDQTASKFKVYCSFEPGNPIVVKLSKTSSISDEVLETPVENAIVRLIHQSKDVGFFSDVGQGKFQSDFNGYLPGDTLSLLISAEDKNLVSETEIPYPLTGVKISFDSLPTVSPNGDPQLGFSISFKDQPETPNYYEVELYSKSLDAGKAGDYFLVKVKSADQVITREPYAQPLSFLTGNEAVSLPFSDELFNGTSRVIFFKYSPAWEDGVLIGIKHKAILPHEVAIVFKSISKSYYQYKTSVIRHLIARESDAIFGASNPVPVIGNITGGVGVFSCQCVISDTIQIGKIDLGL